MIYSHLVLLVFSLQLFADGTAPAAYVLGPDDQVRIWALGLEPEFDKPLRIDSNGQLDLPLIGSIAAGGLTVDQLRTQVSKRLEAQVRHPVVSISVVEFGSQPVSILGAVNNPGVHQLRGRRSLAEVISLAGGLRTDAGYVIKISREIRQNAVPVPSAKLDATGQYSVAEIRVNQILEATNPEQNILIRPHDVITVPPAEMVYVLGAVRKPGGFPLRERESISVLHALSLAEGFGPTPAPQDTVILRKTEGATDRRQIALDLKKILAGRSPDVLLQAEDVLLVPTSTGKRVAARTLEAIVQAGTGIVIWRR
ncbi:MAG: polysaccharide biosynthesis/export family protein [Bryobacteraceae bacterium]